MKRSKSDMTVTVLQNARSMICFSDPLIRPIQAGNSATEERVTERPFFVSTQAQLDAARAARSAAQAELGRTIMTPILQASEFYDAEGYH